MTFFLLYSHLEKTIWNYTPIPSTLCIVYAALCYRVRAAKKSPMEEDHLEVVYLDRGFRHSRRPLNH